MSDYPPLPVIEHDTTQHGRWLRSHRVRIAIWIAVVEGILVVVHVIPWWAAVIVAALAVLFYFEVGRKSGSDTIRQSSWIIAASQALVASRADPARSSSGPSRSSPSRYSRCSR